MPHPIENIVQTTMENLQNLADVNTIVGSPIQLGDDTLILPVSRVSLGFLSGGGEYETKQPVLRSGRVLDDGREALPFAGSSAAGIGVNPVAFLSVKNGTVAVLPAQHEGVLDRLVSMLPQLLCTVEQMIRTRAAEPDSEQ